MLFCQGPHLAKYASKGNYKIRKMVAFLFCLSFGHCDYFFAIQLHVIFYPFKHQPAT